MNILPHFFLIQKTAQTPHILAYIAMLSNYISKLHKTLVTKQDCFGNDSDVQFSIKHNIAISAEITLLANIWAERITI